MGPKSLKGTSISSLFVGIPPYIIKHPGEEVKGSLIDAMNALGKKFDFRVTYAPAKGFDNLVRNVSSQPPKLVESCLLTQNFVSCGRYQGGMRRWE